MTRKQQIDNVTDVLIGLLGYWKRKLKVPDFVIIVTRITGMQSEAFVMKDNRGSITCTIDPAKFVKHKCDKHDFVVAVFHELGHIKTDSYYTDKMTPENAEFNAETQALKWLKKYLPKRYREQVKRIKRVLKNNPWKGKQAYYTKAFKRIKDYND